MATTMQPEIPWNVAGIAPEAREAARASARREGLSVGEWLTRRILRGLPVSADAAEEWWFAENGRTPSNENPAGNGRERKDDTLRGLLQRPDEGRAPHHSRSASGDLATQIKLPPRNDSEIAGRLDERIVRLDSRIARIEIRAAAEEAKHRETVTALQAKLAELTEQISKTAAHSAAQDTQLAKAMEVVAGKFLQSQGETDEQRVATNARFETIVEDGRAMSARIETLAEDSRAMSGRIETIAEDHSAVGARLAGLAEETASIGERIETAREGNERQLRLMGDRVAATELTVDAARRDAGELDRVGGSLDQLTRRFETAEEEYLNNVERFEGRLARIEANSGEPSIDRRLQGIEQALADMAKLIEKNAPEKPATIGASEQSGRADPKPELWQLRDGSPHTEPFAASAPILDLPPFPEKPKSNFAPSPDLAQASPSPDLRAAAPSGPVFDDQAKQPISPELESLIAATRRKAQAGNSPPPGDAPFSWVDPAGQKQAESRNTRLLLLGGLGLLVLVAIGAGFYLSNTRGPSFTHATLKPVHYAAVAKGQNPVRVQPLAKKATLSTTLAAKQVKVAAAPNRAAAGHAANAYRNATTVQKLPASAGAAVRMSRAAARVKPLERLMVLANAGHAKAQEALGLAYLDGDGVTVNEAEGAKWLQRAAARGEAVAAYRLGTLYERGHGVAADPAKAAQWYAVAAKAGNRKAMHNLAVAYAQGSGVRKDLPVAAQWFSRAAGLGLADSQFNLAVLYERGLGVRQSLGLAYKWYAIAAAQGDRESGARMEAISSQLSAAEKAGAEKAAAQFQQAPLDAAANAPPVAASLVGGA